MLIYYWNTYIKTHKSLGFLFRAVWLFFKKHTSQYFDILFTIQATLKSCTCSTPFRLLADFPSYPFPFLSSQAKKVGTIFLFSFIRQTSNIFRGFNIFFFCKASCFSPIYFVPGFLNVLGYIVVCPPNRHVVLVLFHPRPLREFDFIKELAFIVAKREIKVVFTFSWKEFKFWIYL